MARLAPVVILAGGVLALSAVFAVPLSGQAAAAGTRTIYVTVMGDKGKAVPDLAPGDFVVKEDGQAREVLAAAPATEPLHVALLIDNNGFGLGAIRQGMADFMARFNGRAAFSITTTSGRNIKVLEETADPRTLIEAIRGIYASNQRGSYLLDGLVEAATEVTRREFARAAIVAVTTEGEEFSSVRSEAVLDAIQHSGVQVYLVNLGAPTMAQMNPASALRGESLVDETGRRNVVFGAAPARSGGRVEQVVGNTGIPHVMAQMAEELAGQYAVTYRTDEALDADKDQGPKLSVDVRRKGIKTRAPQRVGGGASR
jgi:VWFA-related protein